MPTQAQSIATYARGFERLDLWVREGIPATELRELIDTGELAAADVYQIVLPARTLSHRLKKNEHLSRSEADALVRMLRLRDLARTTFADAGKAATWMTRPSRLLGGQVPSDLLDTESGGRRVEEALLRIAHGQLA